MHKSGNKEVDSNKCFHLLDVNSLTIITIFNVQNLPHLAYPCKMSKQLINVLSHHIYNISGHLFGSTSTYIQKLIHSHFLHVLP